MSKLWVLACIVSLCGIISAAPSDNPVAICTAWCLKNHLSIKHCVIPAALKKGPCYECGPFRKNPAVELCGRKCTDTRADSANCGECGNQCGSGGTCCNGDCASNAGVQWAYYDNPDQLENVPGSSYSSFDPALVKDDNPLYENITTAISLIGASQPLPIYGSPPLKSTYIVLNHRGYIYAVEGGTYTFSSLQADEIVLYWLGPLAYSGWTRANAVLEDAWFSPTSGQLITYTAELQQGQYYAFRMVYANAQTNSAERITVTAPGGTVILGADSVENPYIVRYSCDGEAAPPYPPFGQEA